MGKAYANRKLKKERPEGDFYVTPSSLVWVAKDVILQEFSLGLAILEPCCGRGGISRELERLGFTVVENDLFYGGVDYLNTNFSYSQIIMNPPFSLWDDFVRKAKREATKIMVIGRLNYFGTCSRLKSGLWNELKSIYCFDRYVDYRTGERKDGLFHVGAMATGWFIWEKGYLGHPSLHYLSVQNYARLGNKLK
ncbi:MAG TPA: hypothetical protein PK395_20440 [bacterium]|mgnify:CR=1 FL=1|nr:hypothetical protein [bacterium]